MKFVPDALAVKFPVGDMLSQVLPVQVCSAICALAFVMVWAVTVSDCGAGADAPAAALKVIAVVLNVSDDAADVTFSVTVAVCVTAAAVIEIVPVQVVPAANPAWFTEIVKVVLVALAVKFPVGESVSQLLPVQVVSAIVAVALVLVCAVTPNVCAATAAPPETALNVKAVELNVSTAGVAVTFSVTVAVCVVVPAVTVTVPVHVVPAVRPVWLTEIVKGVLVALAAIVPVGDMLSQLLPVHVVSASVAVALVVLDAVTPICCVAGAVPPATALNVNAWELKLRVTLVAADTSRVMLKNCDPALEDTVAELV